MKMPKRFVDTDIWEKEWFMKLSPADKCLVKYVRDKCDIAGIWSPNYFLASYVIGSEVTEEKLTDIDNGKQFEVLNDGKILCVDFVKFQYGNELNPSSPIHAKILNLLSKYEIKYDTKIGSSREFTKPTIEEIKKEMLQKWDERTSQYQAERFFDYYESVGWFVGKNKMKSWKHAVSNWIARTKIEKPKIDSVSLKEKLKQIGNKKLSEL
jgi:hypothetical protein